MVKKSTQPEIITVDCPCYVAFPWKLWAVWSLTIARNINFPSSWSELISVFLQIVWKLLLVTVLRIECLNVKCVWVYFLSVYHIVIQTKIKLNYHFWLHIVWHLEPAIQNATGGCWKCVSSFTHRPDYRMWMPNVSNLLLWMLSIFDSLLLHVWVVRVHISGSGSKIL